MATCQYGHDTTGERCALCGSPVPRASVASAREFWLRRFIHPDDRDDTEYQSRFPGTMILARLLRLLAGLWLAGGVVVTAATHQYLMHHHRSGVIQTNWMIAEIAATIVGAVVLGALVAIIDVQRALYDEASRA